jgi:hypothetical protein
MIVKVIIAFFAIIGIAVCVSISIDYIANKLNK